MTDLAQGLAEVAQCPARVKALEAEVRELRNLVERLAQERESAAVAARSGNGEGMLRMAEVEFRTGLKRATIYKRMKLGEFPRQIQLGGNVVVWREAEVAQWLDARANGQGP